MVKNEPYFFDGDDTAGWVLGVPDNQKPSGEKNPFYGKKHKDESKTKIIETREKTYAENPEKYDEIKRNTGLRASNLFKGVPKSKESNLKRARKGLVMLKNISTGQSVRISKEEAESYDKTIWVNPASLAKPSGADTKWITDGSVSVKLKNGDPMPEGYYYGRITKRSKNQNHATT